MQRFFLAPEACRSENLALEGSEAHHALHVLRVRQGERVTVLDGAGVERLCEVVQHERSRVHLRVVEARTIPPLPYEITLAQAVPRGKLFESIVQKATELGVHRIVPLLSERVVTHLDEEQASQKAVKWQGVALEAIKQCGAPWLPKVEPAIKPHQFLAQKPQFDLVLVGSLQPGAQHPRKHFIEFQRVHHQKPRTLCVWIGPEGDFTLEELNEIQSAGALPITLGRLVLRTDTAATYCLSFLNYELLAPQS